MDRKLAAEADEIGLREGLSQVEIAVGRFGREGTASPRIRQSRALDKSLFPDRLNSGRKMSRGLRRGLESSGLNGRFLPRRIKRRHVISMPGAMLLHEQRSTIQSAVGI